MPRRVQIDQDGSEERLEKLITERLQPGADKAQIDSRIWDLFGGTWAIMFTDLAGFSRAVSNFGIIHFLQTSKSLNACSFPASTGMTASC